SRTPNGGTADMYLSFKNENGKWTNPKKLEEPINTPGFNWEYGQFISNDGKYLFFTSGGLSWPSYYTYWIKIDNIIDSLRQTNYSPYLNYQIPNQTDSVGYNFNYTFPDSTFIDDDGNNTLTYSATLSNGNPLPSWLSFDSITKAFCTFSLNIENPVTDINDDKQRINDFQLYQNYPNPFNPSTKISWQSSVSSWQTLKVYDVLGKEVASLVDEFKPAGNYEIEFDARNISSGIYFYELKTNTFCDQKKMIVIK
ncbi:MAG: T9SS C-terminal target domain-containing protein, partial [Ignavibacteria bacterium CHB3]|nr:T9SS C-terminal target domain-containing protein [Ignavibacteria bacterium CHB3]